MIRYDVNAVINHTTQYTMVVSNELNVTTVYYWHCMQRIKSSSACSRC